MKKFTKEDNRRIEVINLFGLIPFIHKDDNNAVFSYWDVMYWGRLEKPFQKAWAEEGEDVIPNEINEFSMRKSLSETGTGLDPYQAYENALKRMHHRRQKRSAEILWLRGGTLIRNGAVFYYTLGAVVFKIRS